MNPHSQTLARQPALKHNHARYDRFGNRWQQNGPHSSLPAFDANNRIVSGSGVAYDAAGDTTNDGSTAYTFDAENRITTAVNGSSGTSTYVYDAEGRRVRKTTVAGGTVDFLYDVAAREVAQITSTGSWTRGEIYAGGRHLATYSGGTGGTTYFIHADWLGTERARSTAAGAAYETCTSLPFGDWLTCSGSDVSPMHFTGKERDSESNLDNFGARYNSSNLGRFMSPDPKAASAHISDPQSWNRYSYVRNNPLLYVDPDGKDLQKALDDAKTFLKSVYVKATYGAGFGGKVSRGSAEGKAEVSYKATLEFSNGKLSLSHSVEAGATVGPAGSNAKAGAGISVEQKLGTLDVNSGKLTGPEKPHGEITASASIQPTTVNASADRVGIGGEVGDTELGGGEIGATKQGLSALRDAFAEVKDSLQNPTPPRPTPPPPPTNGGPDPPHATR